VSLLQRFLGIEATPDRRREPGETRSVRRIAAELDRLGPEKSRFLAAFAYVLARVAQADLEVEAAEVAAMEGIVADLGSLQAAEARLVVELAREQSGALGATENYLVTREFRRHSSREERAQLVECLFAVAAADGGISGKESDEVLTIAEELGFSRPEALGMRSLWREHLEEFRRLRR
jgi:uncharacterized tellurite resistance protein B-like protein